MLKERKGGIKSISKNKRVSKISEFESPIGNGIGVLKRQYLNR